MPSNEHTLHPAQPWVGSRSTHSSGERVSFPECLADRQDSRSLAPLIPYVGPGDSHPSSPALPDTAIVPAAGACGALEAPARAATSMATADQDALLDGLDGPALTLAHGAAAYSSGVATPLRQARQFRRVELPGQLPMWTFPEARAAGVALAHGPTLRHWTDLDSESGLRHVQPGTSGRLEIRLQPSPSLESWRGHPSTQGDLRHDLESLHVSGVLLLHVLLNVVIEHGAALVGLDQLGRAIGWRRPHGAEDRTQQRRQLWSWLLVIDSLRVVGRRRTPVYDRGTRQYLDLAIDDGLLHVSPMLQRTQANELPSEVWLTASPWLMRWQNNYQVLSFFGDIGRLAGLPVRQPGGAWALGIALALQQRWREAAAKAEIVSIGNSSDDSVARLTAHFPADFTRRDLLGLFPAQPDFESVLAGKNPKRAREYWRAAVELLKDAGILESRPSLREPPSRQGWQQDWLDEPLELRPPSDAVQTIAKIARRSSALRQQREHARAARGVKDGPSA
jgi:hypothetical protein